MAYGEFLFDPESTHKIPDKETLFIEANELNLIWKKYVSNNSRSTLYEYREIY